MTEGEAAQLRSYLTNQSIRRTSAQLIDALQEAYHQFVEALNCIPDQAFFQLLHGEEWSTAQILEHVYLFLSHYEKSICTLLERDERPFNVSDRTDILPWQHTFTREELLSATQKALEHLTTSVLQAEPEQHLDITWSHFELGEMHWRAWLLFTRVHLIDHVRQLQSMAASLKR